MVIPKWPNPDSILKQGSIPSVYIERFSLFSGIIIIIIIVLTED